MASASLDSVNLPERSHEEKEADLIVQGEIQKEINPELKVYYFIGRLNPPHNGHIEGLSQLIQTAYENEGKVLILLGSGPKGGLKTLNDPIDFELKRRIIINQLKRRFGDNFINERMRDGDIQILEMEKPAAQIASEIERMINPSHRIVKITRFSGDKDGDVEKLAFVDVGAVKQIQDRHGNMEVSSTVVPVPAIATSGIEMSATRVRKDAYQAYLDDKNKNNPERERDREGYQNFSSKYNEFYGPDTRDIYDAIIAQALELTDDQIREYIETTKLPTTSRASKSKKKGGRLTKRTIKNKKLRITRRKSRRNRKKSRRNKYKY